MSSPIHNRIHNVFQFVEYGDHMKSLELRSHISITIPHAFGAGDTVMVERVNVDKMTPPVFTAPREQVIISSTQPVL